jgi:hypothetical protein
VKMLTYGLIAMGGVVGLIMIVGILLPASRTGGASRIVDAPRHEVIAAMTDVGGQTAWRSGVAAIELDGEGWTEVTSRGERIRFRWTETGIDRLALRFESDRGYTGGWRASLRDEGSGTRVDVEEEARIPSPIRRIMARLLFDPDAFSQTYLAELQSHLERR